MKMSALRSGGSGSWVIRTSMSAGLKQHCKESKANPLSSDSIRSGRSCMMVLSLRCFELDCQRGTK